jgi:membrane protease YdiL (CAAX protease family)
MARLSDAIQPPNRGCSELAGAKRRRVDLQPTRLPLRSAGPADLRQDDAFRHLLRLDLKAPGVKIGMSAMNTNRFSLATCCGLLLALVVPLLPLVLNSDQRAAVPTPAQILWGLAIHWINLLALLALLFCWERRRLASIGIRPFRWSTLALGLVAGFVITLLSALLARLLHLQADAQFAQNLMALPLALRLLLVLTAGVFEETLFRGYGIERLTTLLGNRWLAAAITWGAFVAGHAPAVGWVHLPPIAIVSAFITLLYLWRKDLALNITAHSTVDGIGLLLVPLLS